MEEDPVKEYNKIKSDDGWNRYETHITTLTTQVDITEIGYQTKPPVKQMSTGGRNPRLPPLRIPNPNQGQAAK